MIVTGIDLASVHSGICSIEVQSPKSWLGDPWEPKSWRVVELDWIDVKEDTTAARIQAAYAFLHVVEEYKPELVALEDYTHQSKSFDSYNAGELGGMVRLLLWQVHRPVLLVSPMRLKQFLHIHNKTPIHKDAVKDAVIEHFGYKCESSTKKHREDATDAFALAQLARAFRFFWLYDGGSDSAMWAWANAKQKKVLEALWADCGLHMSIQS
jgi:Holliday junction resolvasome RuvABC endonuclease subunit